MQKISLALAALVLAFSTLALAQQKSTPDAAQIDAIVKAAFPTASAEWQPRLTPDETMRLCSAHDNTPPKDVFDRIQKAALAAIEYPADGKFLGDWKRGEALAQNGYGLRFTDYPPARVNGGNCYACHQLSKQELSYGTVGPTLFQYGKLRKFTDEEAKLAYEKVYNSHSAFPCSNMPRFGANKILTIDQIKDAIALLMSPDSPVNKD